MLAHGKLARYPKLILGIQWTVWIGLPIACSPSCFLFIFLVLEFNPRMGQAGNVQRGGFRLDGPVTSRDKVGRCLRLLVVAHTCALAASSFFPSLSLPFFAFLSPFLHSLGSPSFPHLPLVSSWLAKYPTKTRVLHERGWNCQTAPDKSVFSPFLPVPHTFHRLRQNKAKAVVNYNGPIADAGDARRSKERRLRKIARGSNKIASRRSFSSV